LDANDVSWVSPSSELLFVVRDRFAVVKTEVHFEEKAYVGDDAILNSLVSVDWYALGVVNNLCV